MPLLRASIAQALTSLFKAPETSYEQQVDRIRFVERDVCLTIKVVLLGALAFVFLSDWFEGVAAIGELGIETVRGAFRAYLIANIVIGVMLLAMDYLPVGWIQGAVFVINIVDGTFVALLTVITGGLESTIYWVFLVLVIRSAIGISRARLQIIVNLFIILCYLFAGLLDLTMVELKQSQAQVESQATRQGLLLGNSPGTNTTRSANAVTKLAVSATSLPVATNAAAVKALPRPRTAKPDSNDETGDLGRAAILAISHMTQGKAMQSMFLRVLLLLLLAFACYGINVLAQLQLRAREEAREFAVRQEQLRSTGRLAAEIAHQLKNPLAIINNAAFSLQKSLAEAKPAALQQVEMIREEVSRSDRIITELMGYAQLAEGRVERLDVRAEVEHALDRAFPAGLQHEIKIQINCAKNLPPLLMQRAHLREALVNLLTNARDALGGKGRIDVTVRLDNQGAVVINIADNGPGIPDYQLGDIFEPYFSTKDMGTGLGLAIVRHNTEIYGGRATVQSTLGKGTTFTLTFPAKSTMSKAT